MTSRTERDDKDGLCAVRPAPDSGLAGLAELVGTGATLSREPQAGRHVSVVPHQPQAQHAGATPAHAGPHLDFDLENELARAFEADQPVSLEPDFAEPIQSSSQPDAFEDDRPSMVLGDMISQQFDRLLQPEAEAAAPISETAPAPVPIAEHAFAAELEAHLAAAPEAKIESATQEIDAFSLELAALLNEEEQPKKAVPVASIPETTVQPVPRPAAPAAPPAVMEPWTQAAVIDPQTLPADRSAFSEPVEARPVAYDYSDPASALNQHHAPTPAPEPELAIVEDDLERALAMELSQGFDEPAEPPIAPAIDPVEEQHYAPSIEPLATGRVAAHGFQKRRIGRRVAAVIAGVAILGGGAALAWNFVAEESGEPPTILASSEPVKVKPEKTGGKVVPNQDQSVYQPAATSAARDVQQTQLNESAQKPVTVAKAQPVQNTVDRRTTGGPVLQARKVRTVTVRADGTIVRSETPVASNPARPAVAAPAPKAVKTQTVSLRPAAVAPAAPAEAVTAAPEPVETEIAALRPETVAPATPTPVTPKPVAVQPAAPAPKPAPKAAVPADALPSQASPFAVQVASQRSAEAAKQTYATLSKRYGSVIGGKGVDIQKKDIEGKGTYYRVRIPAQSKGEAQKICSALKAKGGDCFVTR